MHNKQRKVCVSNKYKKKADTYDKQFLSENMMGPNSIRVLEEMLEKVELKKGMRVLDLACGRGLTSIFLAKEYGVEVYATDLWTSATENYERFNKMGVGDSIIPLQFDASTMPFANNYFDAVISVDSYHYFGNNDEYFAKYISPLLKKDGIVAIAFPSIRQDFTFETIPTEMKPFWEEEAFNMWRSKNWWTKIFEKHLNDFKVSELACFNDAWNDWLQLDNEYAVEDRKMMKADDGKYMNIVAFTGRVK